MKRKARNKRFTIKQYLNSELKRLGLKNNRDFVLTDNSLLIKSMKEKAEVVLRTLRNMFPAFSFYWDTPRMLMWF